jgi:hypothetical protein
MKFIKLTPLELDHLLNTFDALDDELQTMEEQGNEIDEYTSEMITDAYTILENLQTRKLSSIDEDIE